MLAIRVDIDSEFALILVKSFVLILAIRVDMDSEFAMILAS